MIIVLHDQLHLNPQISPCPSQVASLQHHFHCWGRSSHDCYCSWSAASESSNIILSQPSRQSSCSLPRFFPVARVTQVFMSWHSFARRMYFCRDKNCNLWVNLNIPHMKIAVVCSVLLKISPQEYYILKIFNNDFPGFTRLWSVPIRRFGKITLETVNLTRRVGTANLEVIFPQ